MAVEDTEKRVMKAPVAYREFQNGVDEPPTESAELDISHGAGTGLTMSLVMNEALRNKAMSRMSELIGQTMEEEIFSLDAEIPDLMDQLPKIFADSVVASVTEIMGDATGEALIRLIGEEKLKKPSEVYQSLDLFLQDGAAVVKGAILEEFRVKVHKLYKVVVDMNSKLKA